MFECIKPETPDEVIRNMIDEAMEPIDADFLVIGHFHIPMDKKLGNLIIINLGSVGQPRDGDPRAGCVLFDTNAKKPNFFDLITILM